MKIVVLFLLFLTSPVWGDISVEMSADQTNYTLDDTISVNVRIKTDTSVVKVKKFPSPEGLMLLAQSRSISQSIQIINGETTKEITTDYSLTYSPSKIGKITIPPVTVTYKGKVYTSNSLSINILNSGVESEGDSKFEFPFDTDLFLAATVDKDDVYVGEQITVTYSLYHRIDVNFAEQPNTPSFKDFWIEEIKKDSLGSPKGTKIYKGYYFKVTPIAKFALFPMKSGSFELPPLSGKFRADAFSSMFNRSPRSIYKRKSNSIKINVKELPQQDRPDNFKIENVGDFSFALSLSKSQVEINEPVTLKMTIKGTGNIKNISFPELKQLNNFKYYDPVDKNIIGDGSPIHGEKERVIAIKPLENGVFKPFDIVFSFFDPAKGKYYTVDYKDLKLEVVGGNSNSNLSANSNNPTTNNGSNSQNSSNQLNKTSSGDVYQDIVLKPIEESYRESGKATIFYLILSIIMLSTFLFYIFAFITYRIKIHNEDNIFAIKRKKAAKKLFDSFKTLQKESLSTEEFYLKFYQIVAEYLIDKFSISVKGLTTEQTALFLEKKGIKEPEIQTITNQLENSEFVRFSRLEVTEDEKKSSIQAIKDTILKIESEF
ncbi:protein BatD [bacterium]|nr:protein BatD [bacterium]